MKNNKLYCLLILLTFTLFSCEWESVHPDQLVLPEITSSGKNTFGSIVNGKVWTANGEPGCWNCGPNPYARIDYVLKSNNPDILYIDARNSHEDIIIQNLDITLTLNENFEVGKEIDFKNKDTFNAKITFRDELTSCRIESDSLTEGFIRIDKLDLNNGIVAGIFEADLQGSCDTLLIKKGRFDMKFRPLK